MHTGENRFIEFKSSLRWDIRKQELNKELEFVVIKALAAFLNTDGGLLYIGVNDDSQVLGIESDINTLSKKNEDGFILHLNNILTKYYDKSIFGLIEHQVILLEEKKVAVIKVKKSSKPTYIKNGRDKFFFIRGAASVQSLDIEEANRYIQANWKRKL